MRNEANQTQCCTHAFSLVWTLLAFQRSAIAVVCQHQTAIMNAGSFSYLWFDSWSKGRNGQMYFRRRKYTTLLRVRVLPLKPYLRRRREYFNNNKNILRFRKNISRIYNKVCSSTLSRFCFYCIYIYVCVFNILYIFLFHVFASHVQFTHILFHIFCN